MCENKKKWYAGTLTYTSFGIVMLFIWLLWGDFAWSLKERAVIYVAALMVKSFGISDFMYSLLIISLPNFTNIFLMPWVSYRSDRYRSKWGRRVPFLLTYTPFVVIGLIGLGLTTTIANFLHPIIGEQNISFNHLALLIFALFWIILDLGTTLTNALFMALSNDVVPPELIGRFVALFRAVSLGCAIFFNFFIIGHAESYGAYIFIGLGIFYGIGLFTMCLKVKEGEYPKVEENSNDNDLRKSFWGAVKIYFKECFSISYYRWVIGAYVVSVIAVLPLNSFIIFYVKSIDMKLDTFGYIQSSVFLIAMALSYGMGYLADKFHPIRASLVALLIDSLVLIIGGFFINSTFSFAIVYITHSIFIMSFISLIASYAQRLFPRALFAQYNSALLMVQSFATVIMAPVMGTILDLTGNQYYLTFVTSGVIGIIGVLMLCKVLKLFKANGGDKNYQPPIVEK